MRRPGGAEDGVALIAAIAVLALFGYIALAMLSAERGTVAVAGGFQARARLAAAADAGLVIAAARVADVPARRWHIDSRPYQVDLDGISLSIRIEDERGKIRLDSLEERQVELMFEGAGVTGRRVTQLRDAYLDWVDSDDEPRLEGAEAAQYAGSVAAPRNGAMRSLGELALLRGMDRQTYDRIAPAATVLFGASGAFSVDTAQPLAIAVMTGTGMGAPQVIARQRELAGQRTAIASDAVANIAARPLTVRVLAQDGNGGRLERATMIEFPQGRAGRWVIRSAH